MIDDWPLDLEVYVLYCSSEKNAIWAYDTLGGLLRYCMMNKISLVQVH